MSCFYIRHCIFFNLTHLNLVKKRFNSMIADGGKISKFSCLLLIQFINVEFYINKYLYEFYKILVLFFKSTLVLLFMQKFGNLYSNGSLAHTWLTTIFFFFSASQKEGGKINIICLFLFHTFLLHFIFFLISENVC